MAMDIKSLSWAKLEARLEMITEQLIDDTTHAGCLRLVDAAWKMSQADVTMEALDSIAHCHCNDELSEKVRSFREHLDQLAQRYRNDLIAAIEFGVEIEGSLLPTVWPGMCCAPVKAKASYERALEDLGVISADITRHVVAVVALGLGQFHSRLKSRNSNRAAKLNKDLCATSRFCCTFADSIEIFLHKTRCAGKALIFRNIYVPRY